MFGIGTVINKQQVREASANAGVPLAGWFMKQYKTGSAASLRSWQQRRKPPKFCRLHTENGAARCYFNRQYERPDGEARQYTQPPPRSKEHAITRAIVRRAGEAPRSSEVGSGIGSLRKAVGYAERKTPLCVTLIADASDATTGRNHTRALRIVRGIPRRRALSYDAPVKQHEARSRQRRWPSPECRRMRRGNGTVRCYFIR